jgi:glucosylceramidase
LFINALNAQQVQWVSSSQDQQWKTNNAIALKQTSANPDAEIDPSKYLQTIEGFGTCFNELGWTSLGLLSDKDRQGIMKELFTPGAGANFTICRMPVGANDFSRNWYSYDETGGDFEMKNFSIANDMETLVPFIKNAQMYNPGLKLWASPWSPPSWMKYNKHYASKSVLGNTDFHSEEWGMYMKGINNGLQPDKEGKEGTDMFIQEDAYFKAYALYFSKFIDAYKKQGISIGMVMPQNEFNSAQVFPSCTWTAAGLAKFISYLGPVMKSKNVDVFFGTMERANDKLVDTILTSPESAPYVKGVGFQWAGKGAIPAIHQKYPGLTLYQSEQEWGNGKNDWKYAEYTWGLVKHYFSNGANAYMYWNTSLKQGSISTWGWKQNSLVSVDTASKTFHYNYDYYVMKHLSHFVKPGAKRLETKGSFNNLLAFENPDKSIAVILYNESSEDKKLTIGLGNQKISPLLKPNSFNTFLITK